MTKGTDREGWQAARQRLAARSAGRVEELRAATIPVEPKGSTYVAQRHPTPPRVTATGYVALGLVVIALAGAVYVGGKAIFAGAADLREKQLVWVNRGSASDAGVNETAFNETEAVTVCDLNMQSQATALTSYRAAWNWRIERRAGMLAVRRAFSVRNPYGVDVSGEYTCLVGETTNRIVGLQYAVAGLTVTVPGSDLKQ